MATKTKTNNGELLIIIHSMLIGRQYHINQSYFISLSYKTITVLLKTETVKDFLYGRFAKRKLPSQHHDGSFLVSTRTTLSKVEPGWRRIAYRSPVFLSLGTGMRGYCGIPLFRDGRGVEPIGEPAFETFLS
jgi:hypothetical protein